MADNPPKIGQLITGKEFRDAIHVAVCPIKANESLKAGDHIGLQKSGEDWLASRSFEPLLGVVDPFLEKVVRKGQQCWMFLYPNTITSLRHEWTHPSFKEQVEPSTRVITPKINVIDHIRWMESFAENIGISYDTLMKAARSFLENGDYYCGGDSMEGVYTGDEFWNHYEAIVGQKVHENNRGSFFTCSC